MKAFCILGICLLICGTAWAQVSQVSQINGYVQDQSAAVLPGVEVKVTQTETGLERSAVSDETGHYTLTNLPVGPYRLEASLPGFKVYVQTGIVLQVNSNPTIPVVLSVGSVDQTVQVEANAAMVETVNNAVGQVVDAQRVVELPLNGRQITDLAALSGATLNLATIQTSSGTTQAASFVPNRSYPTDAAISIAGAGAAKTNYILDGTTNLDLVTGAGLPFPFPDALQEFKLETSSLPASAGQLPGGVMNVVTKSGTNNFHGTLFEFMRNSALNARNAFAATTDGIKRNQFGGDLGGPVVPNKLFFFGGYQGTRRSIAPATYTTYVPNAQVLQGDFTSIASPACNAGKQLNLGAPYVNNKLSSNLISPIALKILALVPVSTDPCGKIVFAIPVHDQENQFVGKVDYQINAKQSFFVRYFITDYSHPNAFDGKNLLLMSQDASVGLSNRVQTASIGHTYTINASTVNSFHVGFQRNIVNRLGTQGLPTWQQLGAGVYSPIPNYFNLSVTNYLAGSPICGNCSPGPWASTTYQINDNISMIRGRHQLSFGFFAWNQRLFALGNIRASGSFAFGNTLTGNGLANFMAGLSTSFTQNSGQYMNWRYMAPSLYAQDNFRVNSHLTINAGLRWDPFLPFRQARPQVSIFDPAWYAAGLFSKRFTNSPQGVLFSGDAGMPANGAQFFGRMLEFAPRFGLVYDPRGLGQESIRAGFGIFYDVGLLGADQNTQNPYQLATSVPNPTSLTNPWAGSVYGSNPYPQASPVPSNVTFYQFEGSLGYFKLHPKPDYMEQWNLAIQKQLPSNWLVSATYLGNHSVHLSSSLDNNPTVYIPGNCVAGQYGLTAAGPCSNTGNANYRSLLYIQNPVGAYSLGSPATQGDSGTQFYHGLLVSAQHRFAKNYSLLVNDTWSHCLQTTSSQTPNVYEVTSCGSDIRNTFNLSSVVSSPKFSSKMVQAIAGNWQQSTIFTKNTGPYSSVTTGLNVPGTGTRPNYVPGVSPKVANPTTSQWFNTAAYVAPNLACNNGGVRGPAYLGSVCNGTVGLNTIQGPGAWNVDMAMFRSLIVHEKDQEVKFTLRIEAFNIFNHTRLAPPNTSMSSSAFGQIQFAADPRILQGSLKITF